MCTREGETWVAVSGVSGYGIPGRGWHCLPDRLTNQQDAEHVFSAAGDMSTGRRVSADCLACFKMSLQNLLDVAICFSAILLHYPWQWLTREKQWIYSSGWESITFFVPCSRAALALLIEFGVSANKPCLDFQVDKHSHSVLLHSLQEQVKKSLQKS